MLAAGLCLLIACDQEERSAQETSGHATLTQVTREPLPPAAMRPPEPIDFARDIRPILSDKCFFCHGPDNRAREATGGLRLDSFEGATADHNGAQALAPGDTEASLIFHAITSDDLDAVMPPPETKNPLTGDEIELLRRWIEEGGHYAGHWAFEPPTKPDLPQVADEDWGNTPIDRFILARLEAQGLSPSVRARKETLIRRVSFDLTGLPPTPEEIDAFVADDSPDAYEKVVDRLLASPRFGERMATNWLDQARYGDTNGYHHDHHRSMWPWRDWVVNAYNANMPFDQFITEQLAGDLLPNATRDQILASGFCRNHNINDEGGALDAEYRVEAVSDRVETFATVFMALTFNCTRCHDHKYDPFTQDDYYSLFAYFNSVEERGVYGANRNTTAYPPSILYSDSQTEEALAHASQQLAAVMDRANSEELGIAHEQQRWENQLFEDARIAWAQTQLQSATSSGGATLELQEDGSVFATGENPAKDTHTFVLHTDAVGLRMLLLDALADDRLPDSRVGRAANGNAVLTGIEVLATSINDPSRSQTVHFAWAWADHEQSNGDFDIFNALASDNAQGWAVNGHGQEGGRTALLIADAPFGFEGGTQLRVTLKYQSRYAQHVLGRVKLTFGSADELDLAQLFPTVTHDWFLAGPFQHAGFDAAYETRHGPESVAFISPSTSFGESKPRYSHQPGFVDGQVHELAEPQSAFYIGRTIFTPVERTLDLSLGSDDAIQVYLNGEEVFANKIERGITPDDEQISITLRPGENVLVLKITNSGGQGAFYYHAKSAQPAPGHLAPLALIAPEDRRTELAQPYNEQWRVSYSSAYRELIAQASSIQEQVDALEAQQVPVLIMKELPEPRQAYVLHRGEYDKPDEDRPVSRRPPLPLGGTLPQGAPNNRLGLAQWLTTAEHPLTARVQVNRAWQMIFGTGIVKSTEDFGNQADWPSHPQLLDWLAVEFVESGWDHKHLLKLIVTSATYQQAGTVNPQAIEADPLNQLLAYFPRRRLTAEMIRDQALYVSGLLVEDLGGPAVKPYQPPGLWREVAIPSSNTRDFQRGSGQALYRRSLYTYWKRTAPNPQMATFDMPTREYCVVDRGSTNTPLQALVLWNDEQFLEASRVLAQHTLAQADDTDARLILMFRRYTARTPDAPTLAVLRNLLSDAITRYQQAPEDAVQLLNYGEAPLPETYDPAELAAWTLIANTILNLNETIVRG